MSDGKSSTVERHFGPVIVYKEGDRVGIDQKLFEAIASGKKKTTIRTGVRVALPGCNLRIETNDGRHITKSVDSTTLKRFNDITEADSRLDGFSSRRQLIKSLKEYYPKLNGDDVVTIIRFE